MYRGAVNALGWVTRAPCPPREGATLLPALPRSKKLGRFWSKGAKVLDVGSMKPLRKEMGSYMKPGI